MRSTHRWDDQKTEVVIGNLLRLGVLLAATIVLIGGVFFLARHGYMPSDFRVFQGEPADLRSLVGIFQGAIQLQSRAIIQFGLLLLIATPIARVLFSVFAFALERDFLYVVVTLFVLAVLLYSLFGA